MARFVVSLVMSLAVSVLGYWLGFSRMFLQRVPVFSVRVMVLALAIVLMGYILYALDAKRIGLLWATVLSLLASVLVTAVCISVSAIVAQRPVGESMQMLPLAFVFFCFWAPSVWTPGLFRVVEMVIGRCIGSHLRAT